MLNQPYPVRQICRALRCSRSRHYDRARGRDETPLRAALERLAGAWPTDGDRRSTALLRREGCQVHPQHPARLMPEMGRQGQRPARRPRTPPSAPADPRDPHLVPGLTRMRPDHVWVGDITSVQWHQEFVDRAVVMAV
jgi:hypothetical protein